MTCLSEISHLNNLSKTERLGRAIKHLSFRYPTSKAETKSELEMNTPALKALSIHSPIFTSSSGSSGGNSWQVETSTIGSTEYEMEQRFRKRKENIGTLILRNEDIIKVSEVAELPRSIKLKSTVEPFSSSTGMRISSVISKAQFDIDTNSKNGGEEQKADSLKLSTFQYSILSAPASPLTQSSDSELENSIFSPHTHRPTLRDVSTIENIETLAKEYFDLKEEHNSSDKESESIHKRQSGAAEAISQSKRDLRAKTSSFLWFFSSHKTSPTMPASSIIFSEAVEKYKSCLRRKRNTRERNHVSFLSPYKSPKVTTATIRTIETESTDLNECNSNFEVESEQLDLL